MSELSGQIIRVSQDEKARNYKFYEESVMLDKNIQIVSVDDLDDYRKEGYIIPANAVEGSVLALHPYHPKEYIDISVAEKAIIREKINHIGEIAQFLGARKVEGRVVFVNSKTQKFDTSTKGRYNAVTTEVNVKTEDAEKYSMDYQLERTFVGKQRTSEDYARAKEIMNKYGLYKDNECRTFVDMCNPDCGNQMKHQKLSIDVSSEINSSKEFAFKLGYLSIFELDAKVKKCVSELNTLKFECLIEF